MRNIDLIRKMSASELAQQICIDEEGNERSPCNICINQSDCDDNCVNGVEEWLSAKFCGNCNDFTNESTNGDGCCEISKTLVHCSSLCTLEALGGE